MMAQIVVIDIQFVSLLTQEKVCATVHLFLLDVEFASLSLDRVCDGTNMCHSQCTRNFV